MPFIKVKYNADNPHLTGEVLKNLGPVLQIAVSGALHEQELQDAHLKATDIEIEFTPWGPHDKTNNKQIAIIIFASWFEKRASDLETLRIPKIIETIKQSELLSRLSEKECFVYVRLVESGYAEF